MRSTLGAFLLTLAGILTAVASPRAADVRDTRLLAQPAVSARHLAFVYAGDLWVADRDGDGVRRLTSGLGDESRPRFSPDGSLLAFSARYEGNTDVFTVPVEGGEPRRLTWHPAEDLVQGFSPDGKTVLFTSSRDVFTRRHLQLLTVPLDGGNPQRLPVPHAFKATFSPDGGRIAYLPLYEAFRQWKNYRGGTASRVWLYDLKTRDVVQVPQPEGRCNDTDPMWVGELVFFLSDRNGEFNLFVYDTRSRKVEQLTTHTDFPIVSASAGGGTIIYEQAGSLHLYEPGARKVRRLTIGVPADLPETRPRYAKGSKWIRDWDVSPSGARAVFEFRGEIVTVPAEKGDPRNLTRTPGVNERGPAWSPDGNRIAWFSDAGGEYAIHVASQDGKGEPSVYKPGGAGFYDNLKWSPDGRKLAWTDNSLSLFWLDLDQGTVRKISSELLYSPAPTLAFNWSPDSAWIAYTRNAVSNFQQVYLYALAEDKSTPLTDSLADVGEPVFDASGKYLYMLASTDAGPIRDWFALSNTDTRMTNAVYLAVLSRDVPSPLARQSDEEKGKPSPPRKDAEAQKADAPPAPGGPNGAGQPAAAPDATAAGKPKGTEKAADSPAAVTVDFEGLDQRILPLPVRGAIFARPTAGEPGKLFYLKQSEGSGRGGGPREMTLCRYDLEKREEETLLDRVLDFRATPDGKKLLIRQQQGWILADARGRIDPGKGGMSLDAVQVRVEPRAEWRQIFDEAWRINRDYFYAPNYHGANWPAMREKYAPFLPHLATREDLNRVLQWMCSELAVGHHRVGGGDIPGGAETVPGGLLGADYEVADGRYRFRKVYGGLNWNPDLRSPLTEPGVDVKTGEYLLAVDGKDLVPPDNLFARFENTAGRIVEITVGPDPSGKGSRTVKVVPVSTDAALRNRDWVEGNIRRVHQATDGRVAYVYVPDTSTLGHTFFKRYFFPQAQKEAIILDDRFNGGGSFADYYIDHLRRPPLAWWAMRYGTDLPTPQAAIQGPKAMIIDETAGSGGDFLPWMFHKLKMGPLVGRRTWGGLVGILGFPVLMDGGYVTAPNLAIWTPEQGWVVENEGVPPDIEVEQFPAAVMDGKDPQLEAAIEWVKKQLPPVPPTPPKRPAYPVRVRG